MFLIINQNDIKFNKMIHIYRAEEEKGQKLLNSAK